MFAAVLFCPCLLQLSQLNSDTNNENIVRNPASGSDQIIYVNNGDNKPKRVDKTSHKKI